MDEMPFTPETSNSRPHVPKCSASEMLPPSDTVGYSSCTTQGTFHFGSVTFDSCFECGNLIHVQEEPASIPTQNVPPRRCSSLSTKLDAPSSTTNSTGTTSSVLSFTCRNAPDAFQTPYETVSRSWFYFSVRGAPPGSTVRCTMKKLPASTLFRNGYRPLICAVPWTGVHGLQEWNGTEPYLPDASPVPYAASGGTSGWHRCPWNVKVVPVRGVPSFTTSRGSDDLEEVEMGKRGPAECSTPSTLLNTRSLTTPASAKSSIEAYDVTFDLHFEETNPPVCMYVAFSYPYSYTYLRSSIDRWRRTSQEKGVRWLDVPLCTSLGGQDVPLLCFTGNSEILQHSVSSTERPRTRSSFASTNSHAGKAGKVQGPRRLRSALQVESTCPDDVGNPSSDSINMQENTTSSSDTPSTNQDHKTPHATSIHEFLERYLFDTTAPCRDASLHGLNARDAGPSEYTKPMSCDPQVVKGASGLDEIALNTEQNHDTAPDGVKVEAVHEQKVCTETKQIVLLTSRVHPGETPASHMLHGLLECLLGDRSEAVHGSQRTSNQSRPHSQVCAQTRKPPLSASPTTHGGRQSESFRAAFLNAFIVVVVPMINVDGVTYGYTRSDLRGENLNRMYAQPDGALHPPIHAIRELFYKLHATGRLCTYIDFHAHANKKGVFLYGNAMPIEALARSLTLPRLISMYSPHFDFTACNFTEMNMTAVGKRGQSKRGAGRVAFFEGTQFPFAYTIEANFLCGSCCIPVQPLTTLQNPAHGTGQVTQSNPGATLPSCTVRPSSAVPLQNSNGGGEAVHSSRHSGTLHTGTEIIQSKKRKGARSTAPCNASGAHRRAAPRHRSSLILSSSFSTEATSQPPAVLNNSTTSNTNSNGGINHRLYSPTYLASAAASADHGSPYAPPRFTPAIFRQVGSAIAEAILDMFRSHPSSGLPNFRFRNVAEITAQLRRSLEVGLSQSESVTSGLSNECNVPTASRQRSSTAANGRVLVNSTVAGTLTPSRSLGGTDFLPSVATSTSSASLPQHWSASSEWDRKSIRRNTKSSATELLGGQRKTSSSTVPSSTPKPQACARVNPNRTRTYSYLFRARDTSLIKPSVEDQRIPSPSIRIPYSTIICPAMGGTLNGTSKKSSTRSANSSQPRGTAPSESTQKLIRAQSIGTTSSRRSPTRNKELSEPELKQDSVRIRSTSNAEHTLDSTVPHSPPIGRPAVHTTGAGIRCIATSGGVLKTLPKSDRLPPVSVFYPYSSGTLPGTWESFVLSV